jgi:putative copper export protein
LCLKILLFSVMVVLALINRFRLLPRHRRARSVLLEQALSFAVLAVVSVLGTWPPATHHHGG